MQLRAHLSSLETESPICNAPNLEMLFKRVSIYRGYRWTRIWNMASAAHNAFIEKPALRLRFSFIIIIALRSGASEGFASGIPLLVARRSSRWARTMFANADETLPGRPTQANASPLTKTCDLACWQTRDPRPFSYSQANEGYIIN